MIDNERDSETVNHERQGKTARGRDRLHKKTMTDKEKEERGKDSEWKTMYQSDDPTPSPTQPNNQCPVNGRQ